MNGDINLLGNVFYYTPRAEIEFCISLFENNNFGFDETERTPAGKALINTLMKNYDSPAHNHTAVGIYPLRNGDYCIVIFNKGYCDFLGHTCLIVVLGSDIPINAPDVLQDIIDKAIEAEATATYHPVEEKPYYTS